MASTRRAPHRIDEAFSCPLGKPTNRYPPGCAAAGRSAHGLLWRSCAVRWTAQWQPRSLTNRQRQRGLHEWRLFPISRRVEGLTSAPCRSWRCMSRRAPSWAGWFWSTRLARSRSGKSYEVNGLCILNLRLRYETCRHLDETRFFVFWRLIFSLILFDLQNLRCLLSYTAFVSSVFLSTGGSVSFVSAARAMRRGAFLWMVVGPESLAPDQERSSRQDCEHAGA